MEALISRMVNDLGLTSNQQYSLDGGTVEFRHQNGTVHTKKISSSRDIKLDNNRGYITRKYKKDIQSFEF